MTLEVRTSTLPFSTSSPKRHETFEEVTEKSAIFCLAELERVKSCGIARRRSPEEISFIAEICYPFWLVNTGETSFLFDGLNATSQTITYKILPDVGAFLENIKRSSETRQAYTTFLSANMNYFSAVEKEETTTISGLIADPELIQDFMLYSSGPTMTTVDSVFNLVKISPTLDESLIASILRDLQKVKSRFIDEINDLYASMKLLTTTTREFQKIIRNEVRQVEDDFNEKLRKLKSTIAEEHNRIREEYNYQVTRLVRQLEEKLVNLQEDRIRFEKIEQRMIREIGHCDAEIKTCSINKDDIGERKWKEERNGHRKKLSEAKNRLKEVEKKIKEIKDEKRLKIFELESNRDKQIRETSKDIIEVESARDARITFSKEEMEKLEDLSSTIINQIAGFAKKREETLESFKKLGAKRKMDEQHLIYLPFYLVKYSSDTEKRYLQIPPSIVNSVKLSTKFRSALGGSRIKQLLQLRSQKLTSIVNKFPVLLEQNAVFNHEMQEACKKADILQTERSLEAVRIGLGRLKKEGWLSETEHESFIKALK
ncbi:MAG: hypothetical protein PVF96_04965 [Candidatus Bathyarchaeota archaeon]|jgi:hypothetical protein